MDVFTLRRNLISEYKKYIQGFIQIRDDRILQKINEEMDAGWLWPDPLIQLNPSFESGELLQTLVDQGILDKECLRIFRRNKDKYSDEEKQVLIKPYKHQTEAIKTAHEGFNFILTTGTGSGKSLAYIIPIVDSVLKNRSKNTIKAIIIYPLNALANSQIKELSKYLNAGYPDNKGPVTFARYTGQESEDERSRIRSNPPDILLTNYVMMELILTRPEDRPLINSAHDLRFLVLDELHTYRGRQGADVALLVRRVRNMLSSNKLHYIGTSATLATPGNTEDKNVEIAQVASKVFGAEVKPEHVIGETIQRITRDSDLQDPLFVEDLRNRILDVGRETPKRFDSFVNDPLSIWIESTLGVSKDLRTGRLCRIEPQSISGENGIAQKLSNCTGVNVDHCSSAIEKYLLESYSCEPIPDTDFPPFAFKLHQFISRGDLLYASIEREDERYITVHGQKFVPGQRDKSLFPLCFCRECGQEYYLVRMQKNQTLKGNIIAPRTLSDILEDEDSRAGYLYFSSEAPWPSEIDEMIHRLPDEFVEVKQDNLHIKQNKRGELPTSYRIDPKGFKSDTGLDCHFVPAPFRFCLRCGVSYKAKKGSADYPRLATLATEGRSSATTILSLAAIRNLSNDPTLKKETKKLLSFTDNRQDASLQAGHFNDFVEIGLLRSALYNAIADKGSEGLTHETLVQEAYSKLNLPFELYARNPEIKYQGRANTEAALKSVLGYRLYIDLRRGWRIMSPNLEQCGLLEIRYLSLDELCRDESIWHNYHPALVTANPETRTRVSKTLLDYMRRELAIRVDFLDRTKQEQTKAQSEQYLVLPWALDDNEKMQEGKILYPRASRQGDDTWNSIYLSPRGGFGGYLNRISTFPDFHEAMKPSDRQDICVHLLEALYKAGLVDVVRNSRNDEDVQGYQIPAAALAWVAGDGIKSFHDPIRVPSIPDAGGRTNPFFVELYKTIASQYKGFEAREHTAQVPHEQRQERERKFGNAELPVLFCSPTMELGIDIADLNVVNLRNVPPTPANYAQRSGRAGRGGQPALVFTYCSSISSHDQYFFKRPEAMVSGVVAPPRLDLANENLIRSHVHAVWLSDAGLLLGKTIANILKVEGNPPLLEISDEIRVVLSENRHLDRTKTRVSEIMSTFRDELNSSNWYTERWIKDTIDRIPQSFDSACDRWRQLYLAAFSQQQTQNKIIVDISRPQHEKETARRLRREAEAQLTLLTDATNIAQSDFYAYRYLASEGFLPGYSFPRLPLSAYIPARKQKTDKDEFLSRPRFLAITEFGPRSIIYHEGSRYRINRVMLPVQDTGEEGKLKLASIKQCQECGYIHHIQEGTGQDLCEKCGQQLDLPLTNLFRLQNVSTNRVDKINSDEEERIRLGYEIRTGIHFEKRDGVSDYRTAQVMNNGIEIATLIYSDAATISRINLGWARRSNRDQYGFVLDTVRGYWAKNVQDPEDDDDKDPMTQTTVRVIPFVEDHKNCLIFQPAEELELSVIISLQSALKNALQIEYQLEDNELAAEPLPTKDTARSILFFEAAEGGAGVLKRILDDPNAMGRLARAALALCHYDPDSGEDKRRAPYSNEDCEAACYHCLMSYANQRDHGLLDRTLIRDLLLNLKSAKVQASPGKLTRSEHLEILLRQCQSELEKAWLYYLDEHKLALPSRAQILVESCQTRPDFIYDEKQTAVYVDGPHHEFPERKQRDVVQTEDMENRGYIVIRFSYRENWNEIIKAYPHIFGELP